MYHVCVLGKHVLGCMLWENPIYLLGLKQVEKSGQGLKGMKGRMQLLFVSANISQS